jgi:predicted HTH domain antitoxin
MQIMVEVPEQYLIDDTPATFAQRLKLYAALLMFQAGELSAGAACELAGVDRFTFLAECHRRAIPVINYSPEELREEVESLREQRAG